MERLKQDIRDLNRRLELLGRENVRRASEHMDDYMNELKNKSRHTMRQARMAKQKVSEYTREHPWTSLAIGIGAGVLLGMIISQTVKDND